MHMAEADLEMFSEELSRAFSTIPKDKGLRKRDVGESLIQHAKEKQFTDPRYADWILQFAKKLYEKKPTIEAVSALIYSTCGRY